MVAGFLDDLAGAWQRSQGSFQAQSLLFISLTLRSLGLALLAGLPAGVLLTRLPRLAGPVVGALAVLQTVPSLVLLGLMVPLLGIGAAPALVAAVAYSLFPVVLNTYVGITQVSPAVRDAARGMGMTGRQLLWKIELPLAFPVVLVGARTGAVYAAGMVVLGAYVGAGGLGDYIYNGMARDDRGLIWLGAIPVLVLTLFLFWGLGGLAWLARKNSALGMALGGLLIVALSAYAVAGLGDWALRSRRADVVVGARDFTEGQILAEVVRQALEAETGLRVEVVSNLGTSVALKAMKKGSIDLYPEYTGNLLTSQEALGMPIPENRATITGLVREEMSRRHGMELLGAFGLNNTYAPCVTPETARRHGLRTMSDLRKAPQLRVVVDLSFLTRPDGWVGMVEKYDLKFNERPRQVGPNFLYKALEAKEADLVLGFATDWQVEALGLVVLEDDRGYFPSYHAAPLVRAGALRRHPQIGPALEKLAGRIDDRTMRRMNYEVSVGRRSEAEVAREFLLRAGLIAGP
jgi:osmoprotectant transport system permease protein